MSHFRGNLRLIESKFEEPASLDTAPFGMWREACLTPQKLDLLRLLMSLVLFLLGITAPVSAVSAQGNEPPDQDYVYTVQPGDTLVLVALRYDLSLMDIVLTNHLSNLNLIFPGQKLILPGVDVQPEISSPSINPTHIVRPGETLFAIATAYGISMDAIVQANHLTNPDFIQVGQGLQIPVGQAPTSQPLPPPFLAIELSEPIIFQGRTLVIRVKLAEVAMLSGNFEERSLFFNDDGTGQFWSITAIHALTEPNVYPLTITATLPNGTQVTTLQQVTVIEGPYGLEDIQLDGSRGDLLDPELIRVEQEKLDHLWSQLSPRPRWAGPFWYPVETSSLRITSYFGTRRSYNGSQEISFHSGTDFGSDIGTPIYAAAAGRVVLADKLVVRGNAVLIDHGLGLFSGYWHMNQLVVVEGQEVKPGDLIGYLGETGLVTGPHLHWEMRLNGIAVEPLQWIQQTIP
jgi:murein DD-endopeptidase MepM/ murein hydrolase activator NlpD